jgi:hypothetical protein
MNEEHTYLFWRYFVAWFSIVMLTLILAVAAYNISDRVGPVRPYVHQEYSWPGGTPNH